MRTWFSTSQQMNKGESDPVVRDRERARAVFIRHMFLELYCRRHEQVPKQFPNSGRPVHVLLEDPCSKGARSGQRKDTTKMVDKFWMHCTSSSARGVMVHISINMLVGTEKSVAEDFNVTRTLYVSDNSEGNEPAIAVIFCA